MLINQRSKGNSTLIVLMIVIAVVAVAAIGAAIYFWQKSDQLNEAGSILSPSKIATLSPSISASPTNLTQESPKEVVENFMEATLGTLLAAKVDYTQARTYMTDNFQTKHSDDGWVPLLYGIQDGPTSVKFISENINGDTATVRYDPSWGEMSLAWAFTLEKQNNQWLIDDFRNDAQ